MKFLIQIFILSFILETMNAQEFQTSFTLTKPDGSQDVVNIGYDPDAEDGIDPTFGEVNLLDQPMSAFELRTGQIYNELISYTKDLEHPVLETISQYAGKTEIIPKECLYHIPVSNQSGYLASINLFIKTDSYPVVLKWEHNSFDNSCLRRSFITDFPITCWWDVLCVSPLQVEKVKLVETDSITLNYHSGIKLIDQQGDSVIMLTIMLSDELGTSVAAVQKSAEPLSTPNPSSGSFSIPAGWELLDINNTTGMKLNYTLYGNDVNIDFQGLLLLTLKKGNDIIVIKHINNTR